MLGLSKSVPNRDELDAVAAEYNALDLAYAARVERMTTYREEQLKVRDPNMAVARADVSDYGRRPQHDAQPRRHQIPLPLGKAITVKHAYRIAGRLPDVIVDERDASPEESYRSDAIEKIVWAIIRASGGETSFAAASWNASEIGAGCFDLYMDYDRNMPIFRSVDPIGIYEVPGVDDPHDFQRIYRTWEAPVASVQMEYRDRQFRGEPIHVGDIGAYRNESGVDLVRIVQLCDRERLLRFTIDSQGGSVPLFELRHGYGFVPYVIIPNLGPYEDIWGWADYEFVRALVEYLPVLFSREADVLRAVAAGAYQEDGTGVDSQTLAKIIREGGVASTRRESKVEPIQPAEMPSFASDHGDRALDFLKMLGFAPDAAWGLPGSGSGTDRGLQLQPLLEYTAMKQLNWQRGLSRLFAMSLRMIEKKMVGNATYRGAKIDGRTGRRSPFALYFGQSADPEALQVDTADPTNPVATVEIPRTPKELFDGDYDVRFAWRNMVDPDDPAYVLSELNKFQAGAQSLETTLENLGIQAPQDEMKRIEKEAERFPWVNQGLVSLIMAQLRGNAQGTGGGAPPDMGGAMMGALETMSGIAGGGQSGALDADAGAAALGPDGLGQLYGGA